MKVDFIFTPFKIAFETLLVPVVVSGVLYYITSPIKKFLMNKWHFPIKLAIALIYVILAALVLVLITIIGPMIKEQITAFTSHLPSLIESVKEYLYSLEKSGKMSFITNSVSVDSLFEKFGVVVSTGVVQSGTWLFEYIGKISTLVIHLIVVPFMLFYMLLDGPKMIAIVSNIAPVKYRKSAKELLKKMSEQLHSYVVGQLIVYASVGLMILVGYTIIGVPYALLLALVFVVINCVPLVGVFLGAIPAVIVALMESPLMALSVVIVIVVAHQIDAHLISPLIMGKKLNIHPLTIIVVVLIGGTFLGLTGLIFALPFYVLLKVIVVHSLEIYKTHNPAYFEE